MDNKQNFELLLDEIKNLRKVIDQAIKTYASGEVSGTSLAGQELTTSLEWEDLVVDASVMSRITEIKSWIRHEATIMDKWDLKKFLKPGFRSLFYGPSGTGKTLTAALLGKETGSKVIRINLSTLVSKYIGETEKNLSKVFEHAGKTQSILYFDEADSLFGKRTTVSSSNDRYANLETAYLLQRIEDYGGLVILASNGKSNIDEAFTRRFQSIIHFPKPSASLRFKLWTNAFSGALKQSEDIDLHQISENYELTGGSINNILRRCAISAAARNDQIVSKQELRNAIRQEIQKENKTI